MLPHNFDNYFCFISWTMLYKNYFIFHQCIIGRNYAKSTACISSLDTTVFSTQHCIYTSTIPVTAGSSENVFFHEFEEHSCQKQGWSCIHLSNKLQRTLARIICSIWFFFLTGGKITSAQSALHPVSTSSVTLILALMIPSASWWKLQT
jgi:hypothetical protein